MTIKRNYLYVLSLLISVMFVSCWDNFEERTYYSANIKEFSFGAHDSCPTIENYVFNIDQYNGITGDSTSGTIQNLDSLPYGSVVKKLYPKVTFQSTNGNIFVHDSLWQDGDSIDFTSPVILKNTSFDGLYTKSYTIKINVHQVNPDRMSLEPKAIGLPGATSANKILTVNGFILDYAPAIGGGLKLYRSADTCKTWTSVVVTGLSDEMNLQSLCTFGSKYYITSKSHLSYRSDDGLTWTSINPSSSAGAVTVLNLYGEINRKYLNDPIPSALTGMLLTTAGDTCFGRSIDGINWTIHSKVSTNFPLTDFALIKSTTVTGVQYYTIAGGIDASGTMTSSVWSTEDGKNWISVNEGNGTSGSLPIRKNASLFRYDGYLVSFGGQDEFGNFSSDLHVSPDHGKTWKNADENWAFTKMENGLAGAGVYVQHVPDLVFGMDREFIWILGGTSASGANATIWNGCINKMVFARR
ncbi:MAG TPA: DUF6242 domain-containing protein [Bacteroidales bacterium]|nr:DUF6242 domain-containing protein [Bacteroidales bacterium]